MQSSFVLCLGRFTFLIVDLSFHGQGHLLHVRRQPPCSGGFVCLGSYCSSLANCTGASIEVEVAKQGAKIVLRSCACYLTHSAQMSTADAAAQELQLWDIHEQHCRMFLNRDCAVHMFV